MVLEMPPNLLCHMVGVYAHSVRVDGELIDINNQTQSGRAKLSPPILLVDLQGDRLTFDLQCHATDGVVGPPFDWGQGLLLLC